jgi:hypothetical protein
MTAPIVTEVKKRAGIAGQYSVTAMVEYPGESPQPIEFVGSVYGGPVVMVLPSGVQTFVSDPGRHGEFGTKWVERFFAERDA